MTNTNHECVDVMKCCVFILYLSELYIEEPVFTLELNIMNWVNFPISLEVKSFLRTMKTVPAFCTLAFTYVSVSLCISTRLLS